MYLASKIPAELAVHQHVGEEDHVARMRMSTVLRGISQLSHFLFTDLMYLASENAAEIARLRIRIHLIWIRIQHFRLNADPDPGF